MAVPAGARVVDGRGKYLIPGLWDMHVHAAFPGLDRMYMPLLAANGVTGVREMFSRIEFADSTRARVARGEFAGPRMIASGHILDGAPPIWSGSVVARNADEARRAVDSLANAGAQFIKVYSRLTPEAFHAAAEQAKRRGIPFAAGWWRDPEPCGCTRGLAATTAHLPPARASPARTGSRVSAWRSVRR